jgi:hypothetical protein
MKRSEFEQYKAAVGSGIISGIITSGIICDILIMTLANQFK